MPLLHNRFDFSGAKIALLCDDKVLTILRDDKPDIPYPNMWELPGGGREQHETPFECVQREVFEELGLTVKIEDIMWSKAYPGVVNPSQQSVFIVSTITAEDLATITFGDEGQAYQLMPIADFLSDTSVIPQLQRRLIDYLTQTD